MSIRGRGIKIHAFYT